MRTIHLSPSAFAAILFCQIATAQTCPSGQSRLRDGEPCISAHIVDYLYCLNQSGGGKVEIVRRDDIKKSGDLEISIGGRGSGIIIQGQGSGTFRNANSTQVMKELSEKLDPSLTINCKQLATTSRQRPAPLAKRDNSKPVPMKTAGSVRYEWSDGYVERMGKEWVEYHVLDGRAKLFATFNESKRDTTHIFLSDPSRSQTDTLVLRIPLEGGLIHWAWASTPDRWNALAVAKLKQ